MGTNAMQLAMLEDLSAAEWSIVLRGIEETDRWLRTAAPGDAFVERVLSVLVSLAAHHKWEVRRAVANVAAHTHHACFEPALSRFTRDDNAHVREAARRAAGRRRDWQNADVFGKQHEKRINATLDDVESRFGTKGRDAVKRASAQIADTFARELYHEMIKLVGPVANSAERFKERLADPDVPRDQLAEDAAKVGRRVLHLKAVLDAMRAFTAVPELTFAVESVESVVAEAVALVRESSRTELLPATIAGEDRSAEVCRPRLVQAITNVLLNAIESYEGVTKQTGVRIVLNSEEGSISIRIEDSGCGMSDEALSDASVLFSTSKPNGTGFGLPLSKKIIESEHGGRVTIASRKGEGTSVCLTLPLRRGS